MVGIPPVYSDVLRAQDLIDKIAELENKLSSAECKMGEYMATVKCCRCSSVRQSMFVPCHHAIYCRKCAVETSVDLKRCPACGSVIEGIIGWGLPVI